MRCVFLVPARQRFHHSWCALIGVAGNSCSIGPNLFQKRLASTKAANGEFHRGSVMHPSSTNDYAADLILASKTLATNPTSMQSQHSRICGASCQSVSNAFEASTVYVFLYRVVTPAFCHTSVSHVETSKSGLCSNGLTVQRHHASRKLATVTQTRPPGCHSMRATYPTQQRNKMANASSQERIWLPANVSAHRAVHFAYAGQASPSLGHMPKIRHIMRICMDFA